MVLRQGTGKETEFERKKKKKEDNKESQCVSVKKMNKGLLGRRHVTCRLLLFYRPKSNKKTKQTPRVAEEKQIQNQCKQNKQEDRQRIL